MRSLHRYVRTFNGIIHSALCTIILYHSKQICETLWKIWKTVLSEFWMNLDFAFSLHVDFFLRSSFFVVVGAGERGKYSWWPFCLFFSFIPFSENSVCVKRAHSLAYSYVNVINKNAALAMRRMDDNKHIFFHLFFRISSLSSSISEFVCVCANMDSVLCQCIRIYSVDFWLNVKFSCSILLLFSIFSTFVPLLTNLNVIFVSPSAQHISIY